MKFLKKEITTIAILMIIGIFILIHSSPFLSVRSHIFVTGHPFKAFKETIRVNRVKYNWERSKLNKKNTMIYTITGNNLYDRITGNVITNYKVTKILFLYFVKDYSGT